MKRHNSPREFVRNIRCDFCVAVVRIACHWQVEVGDLTGYQKHKRGFDNGRIRRIIENDVVDDGKVSRVLFHLRQMDHFFDFQEQDVERSETCAEDEQDDETVTSSFLTGHAGIEREIDSDERGDEEGFSDV